jgi:hypothetical protein
LKAGNPLFTKSVHTAPMIRFFRSDSNENFKARSLERDAESDSSAVGLVAGAINTALEKAVAEREGLKRRLDDVTARAAIVGGNDTDDYLTRSPEQAEMLRSSDAEIKRGHERLSKIEENIAHFRFLRTALRSRFPDGSGA